MGVSGTNEEGRGQVGLELDWDKAEVGVGLRWDGVGMKLGDRMALRLSFTVGEGWSRL